MGVHVEGADAGEEPEHVGVVIEGVELLSNLGWIFHAFWTDLLSQHELPTRTQIHI